jgi:hypothetical protein
LFVASVFALAFPLAAYSQDEDEAPDRLVTLDASTVLRLGIVTAPIKAAEYRAETNGFGLVMAYDAMAQTYADLATAEATVQTSETARTRARQLFSADVSISRQTLEAAERQAVADRAQLSLAQRKAEAAWGQGAPWRSAADLSRLLTRLSAGDAALIRVTFSGSVGATPPASFRIQRVAAGAEPDQWIAKTIWRAPADPTVPGVSFFALVEKARALLPGERLVVFLPGENTQQGAVIPADAMLIAEGSCWYYLSEDQSLIIPLAPLKNFTRVALDTSRPTAEGYFVKDAAAGQAVVVEGGGLLLARETGATEEDD